MIDIDILKIKLDEHKACHIQVDKLVNAAYDQGMDWTKIHNLVFSSDISGMCDVDIDTSSMGYDDDVLRFKSELRDKIEELEKTYNVLKDE